MPESRKYTVVDLFAGVGGLSYGFSRNDRFEIILANEMQKDIAKAYTITASIGIPAEADDDTVNEAMNSDELIAYAVGVLYDLAAYMRPQWLDGEDTGMTLEAYFGDSICQTRNGFVTMDKKGYSFDLED